MARIWWLRGDVLHERKLKAQELSWGTRVLDKTPGDHRLHEATLETTVLLASAVYSCEVYASSISY